MDVVVSNDRAQPTEPVDGAAANRASILALGASMSNVVVLDCMLAAPQEDPALWSVVDQVVGNADADALADAAAVAKSQCQGDSLCIPLNEPDVMDVVVVDADLGGTQADYVTRGNADSVGTHIMNVIADDSNASAACDHHATSIHVTHITDRVPSHEAIRAVLEQHGGAVATFHRKAPHGDVSTVVQLDEMRQCSQMHCLACERRRRPEIQNVRLPIEVPFARTVEFLE